MKIQKDNIIFSSGRQKYANCGIIGLSPKLNVSEGYDGGFWSGFTDQVLWGKDDSELTAEDLIELADHMIERWKAFKKRVSELQSPATEDGK